MPVEKILRPKLYYYLFFVLLSLTLTLQWHTYLISLFLIILTILFLLTIITLIYTFLNKTPMLLNI